MTPILFHFLTSTGEPLANVPFEIQLTRSDYDDEISGIVMPRLVEATTDVDGKATVELTPTDTLYHVTVYDQFTDAALHYEFYVPVSDVPVRLQDIVVDAPMSPKTYDEAALLLIHDTKINTLLARDAAITSADAAATSANEAAASANTAQIQAEAAITDAATASAAAITATNQANSATASQQAAALSASSAATDATTAAAQAIIATDKAAAIVSMRDATDGTAGLTGMAINLWNSIKSFKSSLVFSGTANRTHTFPDKSGTVAMLSDITGVNSGTNTGDQTITLTGDVTGSGTGSFAATIGTNKITLAKMAQVVTQSFLGRNTAATGNVEVLTPTTVKTMLAINNVDNTPDISKPVSTAQATADTNTLNSAKAYAESLVVGLWDDRGNYNASGNTFPATGGSGTGGAVVKGDIWTVNVAGQLGGTQVDIGQTVRALIDAPGQVAANWALGSAIGLDDFITDGVVGRAPSQNAVFDALALKQDKLEEDATGGYVGLTQFKINMMNALGTIKSFLTNSNTVARTYTFQDRDGTIADNTDLAAKQSTSSKDASGGYVGLTLFKINFKNAANTITSFFTNTNTVARTYTYQDKDGTIADLADVGLKMTTTTLAAQGGAALVGNTPAGNIAATTVQAAINELDSEKAPNVSPTFTGQVFFPEGTSAAPGIAFVNDGASDTGFYHSSDGVFSATCNAVSVATFSTSGVTLLKAFLRNAADTFTNAIVNATTAARTWTFPDKDGTIALLSDITGTGAVTRNRIINGDMRIDQRNSGAVITPPSGTLTLDRWTYYATQASKFTVQQNAGGFTPPNGFSNYLGMTVASAVAVGAGDYFLLRQRIEGVNCVDLGLGKSWAVPITLSFWVRSSITGTFSVGFGNETTTRVYLATYVINAANTWEYKSVTIFGDTTGTWRIDTNTGLDITFCLGAGSTYTTASGSWSNMMFNATGSTSLVGTAGATFGITGVQLESGLVATPFERRFYDDEFRHCQRYLPAYFAAGSGNSTIPSNVLVTGASSAVVVVNFTTNARIPPTGIIKSSPAHFVVSDGGSAPALSNLVLSVANNNSAHLVATGSGWIAGRSALFYFVNAAGYLLFDGCEL